MVADRAYSPGFVASTDRGASLFYFAAAQPAVGFVHGPPDLYPLNAANARLLPTDRVHESRAGSRYARFLKALLVRPPAAGFTDFWMRLWAAP